MTLLSERNLVSVLGSGALTFGCGPRKRSVAVAALGFAGRGAVARSVA